MDARTPESPELIARWVRHRTGIGVALLTLSMMVAFVVGCAPQAWHQRSPWDAQAAWPQSTHSRPSAEPTWSPGAPPEPSQNRATEAREQVLAFISRLEDMRATETAPEAESQWFGSARTSDTQRSGSRWSQPSGSDDVPRVLAGRTLKTGFSPTGCPQQVPPEQPAMTPASSEPAHVQPQLPRIVSVDIRQRGPLNADYPESTSPETIDDEPEEDQVANRPLATDSATPEIDPFQLAIEALEQRAAESPDDIDALWRLTLLRLGVDPVIDSIEPPPEVPQEIAALLVRATAFMVAVRESIQDPVAGVDRALDAADELRQSLKRRAELLIPTVALCSRVSAFGVFEELGEGVLRAGVRNQAIVYFEIENFTSEETDGGRYRSLIRDRFEVMNPDGDLLWEHEEPNIEDISRSRREDFFVAQRITLPPSLDDGDYVLKVTVEDLLANKRTQAIHEFRIGASRRTARR